MKKRLFALLMSILPAMFAFSQENDETSSPTEQKETEKQEEYVSAPVFTTRQFDNFEDYLEATVRYPHNQMVRKTGGTVRVNFEVNEAGTVGNVKLVENPNALLSKEVIQAVSDSPRWTPGTGSDGTYTKVAMTVSVAFYSDDKGGDVSARTQPLDKYVENNEKMESTSIVQPAFIIGGKKNDFLLWVQRNVEYPSNASRRGGRVVYSFVVGVDGSVEDVKIVSSPDIVLSDAVRKTLLSAPKWKPGVQKGRLVRVAYQGYVDFK